MGAVMTKFFFATTIAAVLLLNIEASRAAVLYANDFNSGDVTGWVASSPTSPSGFEISPNGALNGTNAFGVYFDTPPDGNNFSARATISFNAAAAINVQMSFQARSLLCDICSVTYLIEIDSNLVASRYTEDAVDTLTVPYLFPFASGPHTLALGLLVSIADIGRYEAFFDNIQITGDPVSGAVPIPGALPLFATGLGALGLLARRRRDKRISP